MNKYLLPALLLAASLAGCGQKTELTTTDTGTLQGTWRLTAYQCNCPAGQPVPDETVTFDANQHFQLFRSGKLAAEGTYATSKGSKCSGASGDEDIITLSAPSFSTYLPKGGYTLQGQTLIIDQCSAADGPKYTYSRQ